MANDYDISPEEVEQHLRELVLWFEHQAEKDHPDGWTLILVTRDGFHASYHCPNSIAPYIVYMPKKGRIGALDPYAPVTDLGVQHYTFRQRRADDKRSVAWYEED